MKTPNLKKKVFYYVSHSNELIKNTSLPLTERKLFNLLRDAKEFAMSRENHCEVRRVDETTKKVTFESFGKCPYCKRDSLGFTAYRLNKVSCSSCYKTVTTH